MKTIRANRTGGLSQEEAQNILSPFLSDIYASIAEGWTAWKRVTEQIPELGAILRSRTRASFVFDHIVDAAKRRFHEEREGVHWVETKGLFRLVFDDGVILRFKKFDKHRRASAIPTKQHLQFILQYALELGEFQLVNLFSGYRLMEHQSDIQDIIITCPDGRQVKWYIDIPPVEIPEIQTISRPAEERPTVRPKDAAHKKRKTG